MYFYKNSLIEPVGSVKINIIFNMIFLYENWLSYHACLIFDLQIDLS